MDHGLFEMANNLLLDLFPLRAREWAEETS